MNNKLNSSGLAHVGFFVEDLEASKKFYLETLDFKHDFDDAVKNDNGPDTLISFIYLENLVLELIQDGNSYKEATAASPHHLAIASKDVDSVIAKLQAEGVEFEEKQSTHLPDLGENGCRYIMFRGPDGERLELQEVY